MPGSRARRGGRSLLRENAYGRIKQQILTGALRPGRFVTEEEMASALAVSRTPVREAFAALARDGLLELHPHRGAFVRRPTLKDVDNLFEIRIALETLALRKALANLNRASARDLLDRVERQLALIERRGKLAASDVESLSVDIHMFLLKGAGNERIVELIQQLRERVYIGSSLYQHADGSLHLANAEQIMREHRNLLLMLLEGNKRRASTLMEEHLLASRDMVVAALRNAD